jgi:hypothetical protein
MQQTKELCDLVLTVKRDLQLTYEQAVTISAEVGQGLDARRRNSQLFVELEQVKRVANDQAQLAARLQQELDALKKAVIWYDDADNASECRRAQSHMLHLARKVSP